MTTLLRLEVLMCLAQIMAAPLSAAGLAICTGLWVRASACADLEELKRLHEYVQFELIVS